MIPVFTVLFVFSICFFEVSAFEVSIFTFSVFIFVTFVEFRVFFASIIILSNNDVEDCAILAPLLASFVSNVSLFLFSVFLEFSSVFVFFVSRLLLST